MEELLARARAQEAGRQPAPEELLSAAETDRLVQRLRPFELHEIGTPAWFAQHDDLERLNLQAHANAQRQSEEYVKEALVSHGRVSTLVQELLAAEAWRERLLPRLAPHLATSFDSVATYQLLRHEGVAAELLEVVMFHPDACEAAGEEAVLELADWCSRRLAYLASPEARAAAQFRERSTQEMLAQTPAEELQERAAETLFGASHCALALLRYLTDHSERLSLSVLARIASTNDTALALLPLLERPPWVRQGRDSTQERYEGGQWRTMERGDALALTQQEAQIWLTLNNLLVDPVARSKLDLTAARCDTLFKLKDRFSELLFDQLPVLRDLQRVLDELACGVNTAAPEPGASRLIVEQVPGLRAGLLARTNWDALAAAARAEQFGPAAGELARDRLAGMLRSLDFLCGMEEAAEGRSKQQASGPPTSVKVDAYRRVKEGVWEWWATYNLDINTDRPAERIFAGGGNKGSSCGNENHPTQPAAAADSAAAAVTQDAKAGVAGLRYRLRPLGEGLSRALPGEGKLAVLYGGRTCEATLRLPTCETRDANGLAPAVWLTVGSLAGAGMALQLKLKRLDRPAERDKAAGVWLPYVPVGGGLTVRED